MNQNGKLDSPFMDYLGVEIVSMQDAAAELTLELKPELLNRYGMAHGGVLATLADCAASAAVFSVLSPNKMALTTDFNLSCVKSTAAGILRAQAVLIHRGQRLVRAEVEIFSTNTLLAKAGVSFMVLDRDVAPSS
jgi:uncharacterized protein (TIGR00369 family)